MIPPYPARPAQPLTPLALLRAGRANLLAIWPQSAFVYRLIERRLLWRRVFVVSHPAWIRRVLVENADHYRKDVEVRRVLTPLIGDGLFVSEGERWARQRRLLAPLFQGQRLPDFAACALTHTQAMLARWEQAGAGTTLDIAEELSRVTAEVACQAFLGVELGGEAALIYRAFAAYQDALGRFDLLSLCGLPAFTHWRARRGHAAAARLHTIFSDLIARRGEANADAGDLISLLTQARDRRTGRELAPDEIRDEVATLFMAGHETTAATLAWALFLLAQCPAAETRLQAELKQRLAGRAPEFADLEALAYTRAVIAEALRLYPPIPMLLRAALGADRVGEHPIPAHSLLVIAPWVVHRHRLYWPDPDAFQPERFLAQPEGSLDHRYIPFGAGPRRCPGRHFALAEAVLMLAAIAQRYRLRLRPCQSVEPLGRITLRPRAGLSMTIEPR